MIQLHRRIAGQDTRSGHKCLEAANAAVRAIEHIPNISQWGYIDSIMSVRFFWTHLGFVRFDSLWILYSLYGLSYARS